MVSLITFMPIYLRAVRGTSPAETGLLLLPFMFGIGIGSLVTGQLVTRDRTHGDISVAWLCRGHRWNLSSGFLDAASDPARTALGIRRDGHVHGHCSMGVSCR